MVSFLDRLKQFMNETNLKQIDLARKTGMSRGSISNILSGKRVPNEKLLAILSDLSGKSINWWLYGKETTDNSNPFDDLLNTLISTGSIKDDGTYDKDIELIIKIMIDREIKLKLEKVK